MSSAGWGGKTYRRVVGQPVHAVEALVGPGKANDAANNGVLEWIGAWGGKRGMERDDLCWGRECRYLPWS